MRHPAQRLHFCPSTNTLLVALGGILQCFSGTTGALMTSWSAPQLAVRTTKKEKRAQEEQEKKAQEEGGEKKAQEEEGKKDDEKKDEEKKEKESSPSKKRKVDTAEEEPAWVRTSMLGVGAPRGDGEGTGNSITRMLTVQEGRYLVVVTNEDKTLRVFEIAAGGAELKVLSERAMPKRLCAIATADSENTILLADKFGDVYSVPLLPAPEELAALTPTAAVSTVAPTAAQLAKAERDRLAAEKRKRTEISLDLPFTHTLLLGHVSMLVDIASVTVPGPQDTKPRTYVLTADRDEHIRVSRYPQGHVIEGFCLGHESFVSKLLIPTWDTHTLVSGGGDDFLLVWDWCSRKVLQRIEVGDLVAGVIGRKVAGGKLDQAEAEADRVFKVTVVGLWEVPSLRQVLVAFESVPAIFVFTHDEATSNLAHPITIALTGNPLDLAVDPAGPAFWVSVVLATAEGPGIEQFMHAGSQQWVSTSSSEALASIAAETAKVGFAGDEKVLNEGLLYAVGLLRKGTGRPEREE
ncbi:uncharacterized protein LAJ45_01418 [Morchella importuna]|uniref:uncharacterized protein n=1 Tax=Morchella importuna TaxID=1174673 RepID=UPI001E8CE604|nr:uncharacterized protein LAJ45_01418 [Morchella importuna]KAH8154886.1 hypothetical protein LAJ45_01418 [Morchella importuna]